MGSISDKAAAGETMLAAKLRDAALHSQKRPFFLGFLNEEEAAYCERALRNFPEASGIFWGGYEEAERKMLGLFPEYLEPAEELFPVVGLTVSFRKEDTLSHPDFLGALLSLGVERSVLGDILPEPGRCVLFLRKEMADYFLQNIRKIGKVGVKLSETVEYPLPGLHEFQEISGVVASERIDCMTALLCHTSREKASALILGGMVQVNHREILSLSYQVKEGDKISVRKKGRFLVDRIGPTTAKGRVSVLCRKYR